MIPEHLLDYIRAREIDVEVAEPPPRHLPMVIETLRAHAAVFGRSHTSGRTPIHFAITDNSDFNACAASPPQGGHIVAMNLGLVLGLLDITHSALAHPQVLPTFGDPALESPTPFLFRTSLAGPETGQPTVELDLPQALPRCPQRLQAARSLYELALSFVFMHEVSHITNGHTRYKADLLLRDPIFRSHGPGARLRTEDALVSQAFETDADWFAARLLIGFVPSNGSLFHSHHGSDFSFDERLELTCLAMLLVFQYAENVGRSWTATRRMEHPHPLVRQVSLEPFVRDQLTRVEKYPEAQVTAGYMRAVQDMVQIERVLGLPRFLSAFTPQIGRRIETWLDRVIDVQKGIQGHLRREGLDGRPLG